ncbi:MAG: hypothetical protein ACYC1C_19490 [Chloroflexota bacterium]
MGLESMQEHQLVDQHGAQYVPTSGDEPSRGHLAWQSKMALNWPLKFSMARERNS